MVSLEERNRILDRIESDLPHVEELNPAQEELVDTLLEEGEVETRELLDDMDYSGSYLRRQIRVLESQGVIIGDDSSYELHPEYTGESPGF